MASGLAELKDLTSRMDLTYSVDLCNSKSRNQYSLCMYFASLAYPVSYVQPVYNVDQGMLMCIQEWLSEVQDTLWIYSCWQTHGGRCSGSWRTTINILFIGTHFQALVNVDNDHKKLHLDSCSAFSAYAYSTQIFLREDLRAHQPMIGHSAWRCPPNDADGVMPFHAVCCARCRRPQYITPHN